MGRDRAFPQAWFTPTPEAYRAAAALAEGFCPFPDCGSPLAVGLTCPACEVTWARLEYGFSGKRFLGDGRSTEVSAYPFAPWHPPVIDLGYGPPQP